MRFSPTVQRFINTNFISVKISRSPRCKSSTIYSIFLTSSCIYFNLKRYVDKRHSKWNHNLLNNSERVNTKLSVAEEFPLANKITTEK